MNSLPHPSGSVRRFITAAGRTLSAFPQSVSITVTIIALIGLTGCGSPKFKASFSSWFGMYVAEKMPARIDSVTVEETASGNGETIFQFKATGETTEDLYNSKPLFDPMELRTLFEPARQVSHSAMSAANLESLVNELKELTSERLVLQVATPKGKKVTFQGKARAKVATEGWTYTLIELTQSELPGTAKASESRAWIKGSAEQKEASARCDALVAKIREAITLACKIDAEERRVAAVEAERSRKEQEARDLKSAEERRIAEEKAAAEKSAFFASIQDGQIYLAAWQGADTRGSLGLRCGKGVDSPDGYTMEVTLFVPGKTEFTKSASAMVTGDGSKDAPFVMELRVAPHDSEVMSYEHRDGSGIGFVAGNSKFKLALSYNPDTGTLSGTLERDYMFEYGPEGPVTFIFTSQKDPTARSADSKPATKAPPIVPSDATNTGEEESSNDEITLRKARQSMAAASKPLLEAAEAALKRKDLREARRIRDEMIAKFPDALPTFECRTLLSIEELSVADLDAVMADIRNCKLLSASEKKSHTRLHATIRETIENELRARNAPKNTP